MLEGYHTAFGSWNVLVALKAVCPFCSDLREGIFC